MAFSRWAASRLVGTACVLAWMASPVAGAQESVISGFETDAELADWEITSGGVRLVDGAGVTQGRKALEVTFDPKNTWAPAALRWSRRPDDLSGYDMIVLDVYNPNASAISGAVYIGDRAWQAKQTYWNRHNSYAKFAPGKGQFIIPLHGLYRGEAGGRNPDIKTNIDPAQIVRFDVTFGSKGETGRVIVDNVRFVKSEPRPEGVWAFDFGPEDQSVMPAWSAVGRETAYTREQKSGWEGGLPPIRTAARDTTFGPALTRDFVEAGGCTFRVDLPPGRYDVLVIFENCGYWSGEEALHRQRKILVDGRVVWSETRDDAQSTPLRRFESVEPVGVDLWETYMLGEITRPNRFKADAGTDGLRLRFEADAAWGSRIAGVAISREGDAAGKKWVDAQVDELAKDFRAKAVCVDPPAAEFPLPAAWRGRRLIAWPVRIEDEVTPNSVPVNPPAPGELTLSCEAVRGEREQVCLAVRSPDGVPQCHGAIAWEDDRRLPAALQVVTYAMQRASHGGNHAYRIVSHAVRPWKSRQPLEVAKDVTREFIVTFEVAEDARPGTYRARLRLLDPEDREILSVPMAVLVHDVVLKRETDFVMGMYDLAPSRRLFPEGTYDKVMDETLAMLRQYGMNGIVGEPGWTITAWKDGRPEIDFAEADRFYALARKHAFCRGIRDNGTNFRNLHDQYEKGRRGLETERQSGLDFETAMVRAFEALDQHARANDWPLLFYRMCDETRVREDAERQLEFMKLMQKISARFPGTLRTLGSYSVHFRTRPADKGDLLYWHQRFFENLDISNLNDHDETVLAEARKLGKQVHIYNQGRTRYSFGLYQWSEFRKGVAARWQWHNCIIYGYQFFDLDGREPDVQMICYGREGPYPTIHFERCREGAEDFYLYQTLADVIQSNRKAGRKPDETQRAEALLDGVTARIAVNERNAPAWFDADDLKRKVVAAIEACR